MRYIFVLSLFLMPYMAYAQTKEWSLEECISYAKEHNIDIKSKQLEIENSKINLSEAKWAFSPTVSVSNSYSVSQGRALDPTTYEFVDDQSVSGNSTSVSASLTLFDGLNTINSVKQNKLSLTSSLYSLEKAENDLMLNITAYYLEILLAGENIQNTKQIVNSLEIQLDNTKRMVDLGKVTIADQLQIESQLADASTNLLSANNQLFIAKLNLCQLLEIEDYASFEVSAEESNPQVPNADIATILDNSHSLPELKIAELNIDIAKQDLNIVRSAYYPTVSMSVYYGSSYSSAREKVLLNDDGTYRYEAYPLSEQYTDNLNSYISIGVSIPIFNQMYTRKSVQRSKIAIQQAEYSEQAIRKQVVKEVNQAYIDMYSAWDKYSSTMIYLNSATEALEQIEMKYNIGASSVVDYNTAVNTYIDASTKQISAKYEYIFKTNIIRFYEESD